MADNNIKSPVWEIEKCFDEPVAASKIELEKVEPLLPEGFTDRLLESWEESLRSQKENLEIEGLTVERRPYHLNPDGGLDALYLEDGTPKMWPGGAISITEVSVNESKEFKVDIPEKGEDIGEKVNFQHARYALLFGETIGSVTIRAQQTSFPFIMASQEEDMVKLFKNANLPLPRPALGISTFGITTDGYLTLTVRGPVKMYSERKYTMGGNIPSLEDSIKGHQEHEILLEIQVPKHMYDIDEMVFGGLVTDYDELEKKPDLVGWVPLKISSDQVRSLVDMRPKDKRPNDVKDVVFAPASEGGLFDYLTKQTLPREFCPPTHGGLVLYGAHQFGGEWVNSVMKKIEF